MANTGEILSFVGIGLQMVILSIYLIVMFMNYTTHFGTRKSKMHCVICLMFLTNLLFGIYQFWFKFIFMEYWMLNFSNIGQVAGLFFLTQNLQMKKENSKEENSNYSSNIKFVVAAIYIIILIGSSFL